MKQILFSDDLAFIKRWESVLGKEETEFIEEINKLQGVKNSIVIFNTSACSNSCEELIEILVRHKNKILILDRIPDFKKAEKLLANGVKGYGNAIMSRSYLLSAVEAISNNLIWLAPDITTAFVTQLVNKDTFDKPDGELSEIEKTMNSELTTKELETAKLLRDGYTNLEISETLDISLNTVKTHIKHIYKKLNVNDRISFSLLFS